jgi:hypothetical protein
MIKEELHIECPPTTAFDLMADVRNLPSWNEGASRAELLTEEPIGPGTRFVTVDRGQEMTSEVTTYERPGCIDFDVTSRFMDVGSTFTFTPADGGTRLAIEFEPRPKGVMRVLFPLLSPVIRRDLRTQHRKFKTFCEQPQDA